MTALQSIAKIGNDAVKELRLHKLRNGQPFMINSKDLKCNQCFLEYPDGTIQLVFLKPGARKVADIPFKELSLPFLYTLVSMRIGANFVFGEMRNDFFFYESTSPISEHRRNHLLSIYCCHIGLLNHVFTAIIAADLNSGKPWPQTPYEEKKSTSSFRRVV